MISRPKLADTTYATVATIKLTVADMLTLSNVLYDSINWNEHKGWSVLADMTRDLQARIDSQTRPYINIADRKLRSPSGEVTAALDRNPSMPHPDDYRD